MWRSTYLQLKLPEPYSEIQRQLPVTQQIERHTVVRGCSVFGNGGAMLPGGIALVMIPVIIRILFVETIHVVITIGLCQDGSRSDGKVLPRLL